MAQGTPGSPVDRLGGGGELSPVLATGEQHLHTSHIGFEDILAIREWLRLPPASVVHSPGDSGSYGLMVGLI